MQKLRSIFLSGSVLLFLLCASVIGVSGKTTETHVYCYEGHSCTLDGPTIDVMGGMYVHIEGGHCVSYVDGCACEYGFTATAAGPECS